MNDESYLVVANMNAFLLALEKTRATKAYLNKKIQLVEFIQRRLELQRLAGFRVEQGSEENRYQSEEIARCRRTILYAVQDWALFDFRQKSLSQIIEE